MKRSMVQIFRGLQETFYSSSLLVRFIIILVSDTIVSSSFDLICHIFNRNFSHAGGELFSNFRRGRNETRRRVYFIIQGTPRTSQPISGTRENVEINGGAFVLDVRD